MIRIRQLSDNRLGTAGPCNPTNIIEFFIMKTHGATVGSYMVWWDDDGTSVIPDPADDPNSYEILGPA